MAEKSKKMVRCIECKHGSYMRWFQNPVICECDLLHERFVAEAKRCCEDFIQRTSPMPPVTQYDHY